MGLAGWKSVVVVGLRMWTVQCFLCSGVELGSVKCGDLSRGVSGPEFGWFHEENGVWRVGVGRVVEGVLYLGES